MIHITGHAIQRFQERVDNLPDDEVRAILSKPSIQAAALFGAPYVRLGTGQRVVIENGAVVTVLPVDHRPGTMGRDSEQKRLVQRDCGAKVHGQGKRSWTRSEGRNLANGE